MPKAREYPVTDYMAAIRSAYERATDAQHAEGLRWYPEAYDIAATIAGRTGLPIEVVAAIISALSPRNKWHRNVLDAAMYAEAAVCGGTMPKACTYGANQRKAWAIATSGDISALRGRKVESFIANIARRDYSRVTVDVWAIRAATNGAKDAVTSDGEYRAVELAYQAVAAEVGIAPAHLQAIVWVVVRAEYVRSGRKAA